jgi:ABC-type Na+ efflux pump permease subunit
MNKEKIGLIIFAISAIFMIVLGWLSSWWITAALRDLTLAQINETIWATDGALFLLWSLSIPLGALFAGVGILLYTGSKGSRIWLF